MNISFKPIWFDSLGAKSSCTLVKTKDISVLIDPGIAVMQPSFPASIEKKLVWEAQGRNAIKAASKKADAIVISHYHYDHHFPDDLSIYKNKLIFAKNPNEYINDSQRGRAEAFYELIAQKFGNKNLTYFIELEKDGTKAKSKRYPNPMNDLKISKKLDLGDYNARRQDLLAKGMKWFEGRVKNWNKNPKIPELEFGKFKIAYAEGREFEFGDTKLRFVGPLFHGIEFSRVGWVFMTIIEYKNEKLIHSSDIDGPLIEDYAELIIQEAPTVLFLDGPTTYMIPYTLNMINLRRGVKNICRIIEETDTKLILLDHHLIRDKRYKKRLEDVYKIGEKIKKNVMTVAEYMGKTPKALEVG